MWESTLSAAAEAEAAPGSSMRKSGMFLTPLLVDDSARRDPARRAADATLARSAARTVSEAYTSKTYAGAEAEPGEDAAARRATPRRKGRAIASPA